MLTRRSSNKARMPSSIWPWVLEVMLVEEALQRLMLAV
jgi:hypothetical protein